MKRIYRYIVVLSMSFFLIAPVALQAAAPAQSVRSSSDDRNEKRYYDRDHKDYHAWNTQENEAYRHWLEERHENYRDFAKIRRSEQQEFWNWRHDHPEHDRR